MFLNYFKKKNYESIKMILAEFICLFITIFLINSLIDSISYDVNIFIKIIIICFFTLLTFISLIVSIYGAALLYFDIYYYYKDFFKKNKIY